MSRLGSHAGTGDIAYRPPAAQGKITSLGHHVRIVGSRHPTLKRRNQLASQKASLLEVYRIAHVETYPDLGTLRRFAAIFYSQGYVTHG